MKRIRKLLPFQSEFLSVAPQEDSDDDSVSYVAPPYSPLSVTSSPCASIYGDVDDDLNSSLDIQKED